MDRRPPRVWVRRLAIPGALVLGGVLAWCSWQTRGRGPAPPPAAVPGRESKAEPAVPPPPGSGLRAEVPPPREEASALKLEAVAVAGRVAEAYPNDPLTYALLGSAYYNTGQSDEATKYLEKCLELSPDQAEAYEVLALIAYEKGNLEDTVRLCQQALERGPANPEVLNRLGRAFMDQGQTEQAIPPLQRAVALPRPISESSYLLGQTYLQSGDPAQAKESFLRAIALLPDHTQAFFGLFTACSRLGQTEEAVRYREQFQKLEAIDRRTLSDQSARDDTRTGLPQVQQTVARTFFGAAQVQRAHGQTGKAAELLRKSATLDPDNLTYRAALEAHYVQAKELAEGVKVFQQLAAEQPGNTLNHFYLGRMHGRLDQFEAAERSYQKVRELTPDWPEGHRALAELYLRANRRTADAPGLARRVVELEPSASHYYLLAVSCLKNGDRPGALAAATQAVSLKPSETRYQQLLQRLQPTP